MNNHRQVLEKLRREGRRFLANEIDPDAFVKAYDATMADELENDGSSKICDLLNSFHEQFSYFERDASIRSKMPNHLYDENTLRENVEEFLKNSDSI